MGTAAEWLDSLQGVAQDVQLRVSGGFIQWKLSSDATWTNLISTASLTGAPGASGNFLVLTAGDPVPGGTSDNTIIFDAIAAPDSLGVIGTAGSAGVNGVNTFNIGYTRGISSGQFVVAGYIGSGEGGTVDAISVTDTKGNTFTVDGQSPIQNNTMQTATISGRLTTAVTTSDHLTVTITNPPVGNKSRMALGMYAVKGILNPGRVDKQSMTSGANQTLQSIGPTTALAQTNEIVFALTCTADVAGMTWTESGSGYSTALNFDTTGTAPRHAHFRYKIVAATTAVSASSTTSAQCVWSGMVQTYKGN